METPYTQDRKSPLPLSNLYAGCFPYFVKHYF